MSVFPLLAGGIGDQEAGPWGVRCVFVFGVRPLPKLHELSAESWEGGGHVSGPCIWAKGPVGGLSVGAREVEGKSAESVNMDA